MILRPEGQQTITSNATVNTGVGKVVAGSGTLLSALTITFPSNPNDRDNLLIFFNGGITLLTLTIGSFLGTLPTTAATGICMCFEYEASTAKWYRLY